MLTWHAQYTTYILSQEMHSFLYSKSWILKINIYFHKILLNILFEFQLVTLTLFLSVYSYLDHKQTICTYVDTFKEYAVSGKAKHFTETKLYIHLFCAMYLFSYYDTNRLTCMFIIIWQRSWWCALIIKSKDDKQPVKCETFKIWYARF